MAVTEQGVLTGIEGFAGELLGSSDEGYEEARSVHNGLVDKRPALIARCHGVADVCDAIAAARSQGWRSRSGAVDITWPGRRSRGGS